MDQEQIAWKETIENLPDLDAVWKEVKDLDAFCFLSLLATIVDMWAERNELTQEQTLSLLRVICKIQEEVHDEFGSFGGN